jgi:hypothetical protein
MQDVLRQVTLIKKPREEHMAARQALGIVYDEYSKKVLVLNEYGALDITRFIKDMNVEMWGEVQCKIEGSLMATYNPEP